MAEVWAARVEGPQGFVKSLALKFILETFRGDAELERLFVNEARVAAQLQHANLVGVFDFDKVSDDESGGPGRYYIAMERIEGHDLRRLLQVARHNGHRLSPAIALYVAGEVLKGLRYVHERRDMSGQKVLGLVHRDVSPHNVLVGMGGEVKLSDFGIAKAVTQSLGTQSGMIRGKLSYASPEQLRGEGVDHRTDQFGAGVTLWEMLADQRLFDGTDEMEIIAKVMRCEIPPIGIAAGVDPAVEAIARRMLGSQVGDRFPSTADALSSVLAAPGYLADATPLAELMRDLFAPRAITLPPTVPMNLAAPSVSGLKETSQLDRGSPVSPFALSPSAPGIGAARGPSARGIGAEIGPSVELHRPQSDAGAPRPSSSWPEAVPVPVEPATTVTGSSYVSGAAQVTPTAIARSLLSGRPVVTVALVATVAVVVAGGIVLISRRAGRQTTASVVEPAAKVHAGSAGASVSPGARGPGSADSVGLSASSGQKVDPGLARESPDQRAGALAPPPIAVERIADRISSAAPEPPEEHKRRSHRGGQVMTPTEGPGAGGTAHPASQQPGRPDAPANRAPILE